MYVVATDRFMSGWGKAPGRSLVAIQVDTDEDLSTVKANLEARSEMLRVRLNLHLPRVREGDHLHVVTRDNPGRWYVPHGFCEKGPPR